MLCSVRLSQRDVSYKKKSKDYGYVCVCVAKGAEKNRSHPRLGMNHRRRRLLEGCINASMSNGRRCNAKKEREAGKGKETIKTRGVEGERRVGGGGESEGGWGQLEGDEERNGGSRTGVRRGKERRSFAQRLMDSGANLTVGGFGHVGLFFWWRWPTLPHKRLPRAAEYCIGCLKGLLQRRESMLRGEGENERERERTA